MEFEPIFLLNIVGSFLAFGLLTRLYIWPRIRVLAKHDALKVLTLPHTFRFIGLSFLFPGVVSPMLPPEFTVPAAWGDFGAAILAFIAIIALSRRWSFAILLVWLFNLWGSIDLIYAYYQGLNLHLKSGLFGAAIYIPTTIVPALLVTHVLIFMILLRKDQLR